MTPASGQPGAGIAVTFRARNRGSATAAASVARLWLTASSTLTPTASDPRVGADISVSSLAASACQDFAPAAVPLTATAGARYLWLILDVNRTAGQGTANEADDWANVPFTVAASDVPSGLTFLSTNAQGYREYRNEKDGSVLIEVPAGTMDLAGNVWEWVNDWYDWRLGHLRQYRQVSGPDQ